VYTKQNDSSLKLNELSQEYGLPPSGTWPDSSIVKALNVHASKVST